MNEEMSMKAQDTYLKYDPWLAPYQEAIVRRAMRGKATGSSSPEFPLDWQELFGLHHLGRTWNFFEWAPNATAMWLVGDFSGWKRTEEFRLQRASPDTQDAPDGMWGGIFAGSRIHHGDCYRLDVVWEGGEGERLPSAATRVVQDPATQLFNAQVWKPARSYRWKHKVPLRSAMPLIYEAHIGMATEDEKVGSYAEFTRDILPRIKRAGYDTVQLMGIMEHPYYGSFGYHVSNFFAASSRFGTPEELKALIDTAHGMGLRVIMDLVHSHAVRNEREGLSRFDGTTDQYFHAGPRGWHEAWDSRCFDYAKKEVRWFLLSNCRFWLQEYHFDGFRFDGVTSMLYRDHGLGTAFTNYRQYFDGNVDEDAWQYLAEANATIHALRPDALTIAEDVSGMPGACSRDGGLGFDLRMAMGIPDYWFKLAETMRDEDWNMHGLWHALTNHRPEEKTVSYVESHDQALVGGKSFFFDLADAAVYDGMGKDQHNERVERAMALSKLAKLTTLATSEGAYLNFMGNEFGHPEWIDFPREGNGWSYAHARRLWSLADDPKLKFKALGDFDAAILELLHCGVRRRARPTIWKTHRDECAVQLAANDADQVLAFIRDGYLVVANFNPIRSFTDYGVMVPSGRYRLVMDTDEARFGGFGRIAPRQIFHPTFAVRGCERIQQIQVYLPARTALVLKRLPPGIRN